MKKNSRKIFIVFFDAEDQKRFSTLLGPQQKIIFETSRKEKFPLGSFDVIIHKRIDIIEESKTIINKEAPDIILCDFYVDDTKKSLINSYITHLSNVKLYYFIDFSTEE